MSMIYDNWERLVKAVLDREHFRQLCLDDSSVYSTGTSSDSRFSSPLNDVASLRFPSPVPNIDARSSLSSRFSSPLTDFSSLRFPSPVSNIDARSSISSLTAKSVFQQRQTSPVNTLPLKTKAVFKVDVNDDRDRRRVMKAVTSFSGIEFISMDLKLKRLTVVGDIDPIRVTQKLRKSFFTEILSVGPAK